VPDYIKGKCLFCGGPATGKAFSKEHVWPVWARDLLAEFGYPVDDLIPLTQWDHGTGAQAKVHHTPASALTVGGVVCRGCNSGWMSQLEGAVQPIFRRLLTERPSCLLTVQEQETLATWALMKAIVYAFSRESPPPQSLVGFAKEFYSTRRVPSNHCVWASAYGGPDFELIAERASVLRPKIEGIGPEAVIWVSLLLLGPVILTTLGTTADWLDLERVLPTRGIYLPSGYLTDIRAIRLVPSMGPDNLRADEPVPPRALPRLHFAFLENALREAASTYHRNGHPLMAQLAAAQADVAAAQFRRDEDSVAAAYRQVEAVQRRAERLRWRRPRS
jgi:hypothetical protein